MTNEPSKAGQTNKIGSLEVSVAGTGCNNFGMRIDEERSRAVVDAALDAGVTLFDTADLYGGGKSEEFLGHALGSRRDRVVLTTKFGMKPPPDGLAPGSPEWVARAMDESLQRLGVDHVDLFLQHQPDPTTPIGDTLEAMNRLVDAGKAREIGGSNFSAAQLEEMAAAARERGVRPFVNLQNEYSLVQREPEAEVIPTCRQLGITFVPYFPLASGLLTGKYERNKEAPEGSRLAAWGDRAGAFLSDERFDLVERLDEYARGHGHTLHELALSWLATNPAVASVIAGATSPEQVRSNAAATTAWQLTDTELAEVAALL
jgi:aryl-alcohol dehydrogenase-like predicted oxidoreductase